MIRIAICDDDEQELARSYSLLTQYQQNYPQYEIEIYSFTASLELLCYVAEHGSFDVLLLDIYMAGQLGTDVARELRRLGYHGEIIFLTTSRDHSLEAYEVDAAQYLIKPYEEERLFTALNKVIERINVENSSIISLKTSDGIARLRPREVVYTKTGRNNYQIIHIIKGKTLEVRMTSMELFELLSQSKFFVRCGAAMNLNLKYIRQISKEAIIFDNGEHLVYPYRSYQKLKDEFLHFQMDTDD